MRPGVVTHQLYIYTVGVARPCIRPFGLVGSLSSRQSTRVLVPGAALPSGYTNRRKSSEVQNAATMILHAFYCAPCGVAARWSSRSCLSCNRSARLPQKPVRRRMIDDEPVRSVDSPWLSEQLLSWMQGHCGHTPRPFVDPPRQHCLTSVCSAALIYLTTHSAAACWFEYQGGCCAAHRHAALADWAATSRWHCRSSIAATSRTDPMHKHTVPSDLTHPLLCSQATSRSTATSRCTTWWATSRRLAWSPSSALMKHAPTATPSKLSGRRRRRAR